MKIDHSPQSKPTVAHLIASNIMGGVEIATLRLTAAMSQQFRHVAFCVDSAEDLRQLFEKQGTETATYTLPTPSLRHGNRFFHESNAIANELKSYKADIVHFADVYAASRCSLAGLLAHARTVCHVRLSHPTITLRDQIGLWPVDHYVFVSQEARRTFGLRLKNSKTQVIYDAVEIPPPDQENDKAAVRREFGISESCPLVGSVVRIAPQKDFETLASAATKVLARHPATRFLVVGDRSSDESLRKHYEYVVGRLRELKIAKSFVFTGYRADVPRFIGAMDICVLCTHREGFPLSILEFMAKRKPVVATAVGGVPEIVKHGETGYLHEHLDSEGLADAILSLIESPAEAERIASTGFETVKGAYSREKYIGIMAGMYFNLLGRKPIDER